jgi:hypothetical protein
MNILSWNNSVTSHLHFHCLVCKLGVVVLLAQMAQPNVLQMLVEILG